MLQESGERLSVKVHSSIMVEHVHRYAFAAELVEGKTVLDIASGEGYGTNLLAKHAAFVYGVDKSAEAIAHANANYAAVHIRFLQGDVTMIPLADHSVDVVVSFETIEHLDMHDEMMAECKRVLKTGGMLVISTPDKHFYSDVTRYRNPYHVKELYEQGFIHLLKRYFNCADVYRQGIVRGGIIYKQGAGAQLFSIYHGDYTCIEQQQQVQAPEYMIIVAGDGNVPQLSNSLFESDAVDAKLVRELERYKAKYEAIIQSRSYKLARLIRTPLKWFKAGVKK